MGNKKFVASLYFKAPSVAIFETIKTLLIHTIGACEYSGWIGNGWCDDVTNTEECNYDGGDCCGPNVNTDFCSECICN